jgi:hypothetical protein
MSGKSFADQLRGLGRSGQRHHVVAVHLDQRKSGRSRKVSTRRGVTYGGDVFAAAPR